MYQYYIMYISTLLYEGRQEQYCTVYTMKCNISDLLASASHPRPGLAGREADVEDHRGVAGDVVDIAGGGVDEEDLSVRSNSVT